MTTPATAERGFTPLQTAIALRLRRTLLAECGTLLGFQIAARDFRAQQSTLAYMDAIEKATEQELLLHQTEARRALELAAWLVSVEGMA